VRVNSTANGFRPTTHQGGFGSLLFDNTAFNANAGNVLHPSGAFTVSAWVNASSFNTTGGAPTILAKYKDSVGVAKEYIFNFNANNGSQLALICYDDANGAFIGRYYSGTLPTNKWHHVAASYNGGTTTAAIQVYLNGARVDDSNVTAGTFANINSFTTPTMIGAAQSSGNANYFFKGNINDVRFYNRKLNISEIQAMYLNSLQGYPGLLNHTSRFGYFPANKNSGFKGIDIVQTNTELVLRSCMLNNSGAAVTTGSTQIYLFEIQSDGDLKQYDWSTNTFSYGTLSSPSITAKQQGNTGMWTYALFNTQAFTNGAMYIAEFNNSNASPMWQAQEFQFGNQPGDDGFFQEFVAKPNNSLTVLNTNRTEASGYWNSAEIAFTTGSLKGKSAKVSSYSGGSFTLSASLPSTPNVGDRGIIISVQ
jgi:hypothetical protein